jgi:hypothetical protein
MSTSYYIYETIPVTELFGGRLDKYGVRDGQSPNATADSKCLTDGENNYLWAYGNPVAWFTRYFPNGWPEFILQSIATEFDVEIYSDYDLADAAENGEEAPTPCYVPLEEKPTDEEIERMRADWTAESEALHEKREELRRKWRAEREAAS